MAALDLDTLPIPIPVEAWIERPLGYRLGLVEEAELGAGVLGLARPTTGEILIDQSVLANEGRYRFTCAHELGHLILHRAHSEPLRDHELPHNADASEVEHEADRFAAAMLMPVQTLGAEIERIRAELALSTESYPMLRGDDVLAVWLWRRCFIPALAERYQVSRAAMIYRCRELRLPGQRRLIRPSLVPLLVAPERLLSTLPLDQVSIRNNLPMLNPS